MAYRSVFTVVTGTDHAALAISAAANLCAAHAAHLDILALGIDNIQLGYAYVGSEAVLVETAMQQAATEARAHEKAARAAVEAQSPGLAWALETAVVQIGMLSDLVANRARFADLVILPRPYGRLTATGADIVVESALFNARAPVVILPTEGAAPVLPPRRIVLAWNQSPEALTATRLALPFLKTADQVVITVVDPPVHGPERSDPGGLLCQMLVRHGVKAEVSVLARTLPKVSDVLARQVQDLNAEMLVMGAYGKSRLREAILGGATRNLLESAEVPVFLAH